MLCSWIPTDFLTQCFWWYLSGYGPLRWLRESPQYKDEPCWFSSHLLPQSGTFYICGQCPLGKASRCAGGVKINTLRLLTAVRIKTCFILQERTTFSLLTKLFRHLIAWKAPILHPPLIPPGASCWSRKWCRGVEAAGFGRGPRASAPVPQAARCGWCRHRFGSQCPRPRHRGQSHRQLG